MALPLTLRTDYGGSLTDVGLNASLAAALEVPLMLMWAYAAKRWSNESLIALNGVLFAVYLALIPFAGSVQGVLWLQGLNALATSALLSLIIAYMQEAIAGRVGTSGSLMDTVTVLATLAASAIFAVMAGPEGYRAIFPVIAVFSLAGAVLIWVKGRGGQALA
jgi:predicted MFS family arabinose efflux permease